MVRPHPKALCAPIWARSNVRFLHEKRTTMSVELPEDYLVGFETICHNVNNMSGTGRNLDVGGAVLRLQKLYSEGELIEGDLVRLRMDYLPPKGKRTGELAPLGLLDDEGI